MSRHRTRGCERDGGTVLNLWLRRVSPQPAGFRPPADVFRTHDPPAVHVVVDLAGVDPDKVDISVVDGALVISGQRQRPAGGERRYEHIEIDYGPFQRRLALGDGFDAPPPRRRTSTGC